MGKNNDALLPSFQALSYEELLMGFSIVSNSFRRLIVGATLLCALLVTAGCGLLFGSGPEPTPAPPVEARQLVPTFTATPVELAQAPTETPTQPPAPTTTPTAVITATQATTATTALTTTNAPTATATPSITARLTIAQEMVNVRLGPGTDYGLAGEATQGQVFDIVGKNQQGDWWQVCCINGQQVWVFNQLATVQNTEAVPVITDLPALPVAQAPTVATPAPAQPPAAAPTQAPTQAPAAAPTDTPAPAAPPPAADACAGIGGDGCKFRVSGGPKFQPNGGTELKLQLMFKHSGDGNRPQGSYFVAMFKDGQKLPIGDGTRSLVDVRQQGPLGEYNYEYKVGLGEIPGGTVAGNYVIYVLDGNGERDSQDIAVSVPEGQGEIWIEFDQG
jgi:uncharacterized protein YraI